MQLPAPKTVSIAGDFNNWNIKQSQMKKLSNGDFSLDDGITMRAKEVQFLDISSMPRNGKTTGSPDKIYSKRIRGRQFRGGCVTQTGRIFS